MYIGRLKGILFGDKKLSGKLYLFFCLKYILTIVQKN